MGSASSTTCTVQREPSRSIGCDAAEDDDVETVVSPSGGGGFVASVLTARAGSRVETRVHVTAATRLVLGSWGGAKAPSSVSNASARCARAMAASSSCEKSMSRRRPVAGTVSTRR